MQQLVVVSFTCLSGSFVKFDSSSSVLGSISSKGPAELASESGMAFLRGFLLLCIVSRCLRLAGGFLLALVYKR